MSENERLRSEIKRISKCLHYETDGKLGVIGSLFDAMHIADEALAAKPETCVWTHHPNYTYTRSCDGRKTALMPGSYLDGGDFETDTICSGCGSMIEVRS